MSEVAGTQGDSECQKSFTIKCWYSDTVADYKPHEYTLDEEGVLWCWPTPGMG